MTVTTSYAPLTHNCNGSATTFNVTWPFFLSTDLVVTHITSAGVETALVLTTDYTVSGGRDSTTGLPAVGTITTVATYAAGVTLRITRATPKTQSSSFTTSGAFPAKVVEAALDRVHMIAEEGAGGAPVQDIDGSALRLETSGATNYWDGENYILRNLADGSDPTDAVNYQQLSDAVLDSGNWLGTAGSSDNRVLRSDGTAGATLQSSSVSLSDDGDLTGLGRIERQLNLALSSAATTAATPSETALWLGVANATGMNGSTTKFNVPFGCINLVDTITNNYPGGYNRGVMGLEILHSVASGAGIGNRAALYAVLSHGANTGTSGRGTHDFYTASFGLAQATANDGGTAIAPKGNYYAFGGVSRLQTPAAGTAYFTGCIGAEFDCEAQTGIVVSEKIGVQIALINADYIQGSVVDAAIGILSDTLGATLGPGHHPGWKNGIIIGKPGTRFPLDNTSGAILSVAASMSGTYGAAFGINLSGVTFTQRAFQSTGFDVYPDGTVGTVGLINSGTIELGHATDTTISRSSAGVIAVEGVTVALNSTTAAAHIASSIELGHATDTTLERLSAGVLGVEGVAVALNSISAAAHVASSIELGHATDTTLSRSAAGRLAVEGNNVFIAALDGTWTTYTPTVTASSGSITSYSITTAKYHQVGKNITVFVDVTISNAGTGSGALLVTLPAAAAHAISGNLSGREAASTGVLLGGQVSSTDGLFITRYDGASVIVTGYRVIVTAAYVAS